MTKTTDPRIEAAYRAGHQEGFDYARSGGDDVEPAWALYSAEHDVALREPRFHGVTDANRAQYADGKVGTNWTAERPDTIRCEVYHQDTRTWTVLDLVFPVKLEGRTRERQQNLMHEIWTQYGELGIRGWCHSHRDIRIVEVKK